MNIADEIIIGQRSRYFAFLAGHVVAFMTDWDIALCTNSVVGMPARVTPLHIFGAAQDLPATVFAKYVSAPFPNIVLQIWGGLDCLAKAIFEMFSTQVVLPICGARSFVAARENLFQLES